MHAQHTRPTLLLVGLLLTVTAPGLWACDPCDEDHHKHDHEEWEEECDPDEADPECTVWFQDGAYYSACGDGPDFHYYGDDACYRPPARTRASSGACGLRDTLIARAWSDDYEAATLSFERATILEDGCVRNDWDLLFGNDQLTDTDHFTVNTVTDDASSIVDLGPIDVAELPPDIERDDYAQGYWGGYDNIPVQVGHLYLTHTRDDNTRQFALFRVVEHDLNRSVTIAWQIIPGVSRPIVRQACAF